MARNNLQIKVGTYTGNGVDSRNITGIGFRPQLVLTHRNSVSAVWRNSHMRGDATADFASTAALTADWIQELQNDGFQVGTATNVNANAIPYYYLAIRGNAAQAYFRTGKYSGSGADDRNFTSGGLGFTPDFAIVKGDTAQNGSARIAAQSGDTSFHFPGVADGSNEIQNLQANGFQLGTSARTNSASTDYYFWAMKHVPGGFKSGTYTGTGASKRITGLGFNPDLVIVKNGNTTGQSVMLSSGMVSASVTSIFTGNGGTATDGINSLDDDGFTVGALSQANNSGDPIWWVAFKSGDYNVPLIRTVV